MRTPTAATCLVLLVAIASPFSALAQDGNHWVWTWATGLQAQTPPGTESERLPSDASGALFGPSALDRFDRNVLLQPDATHVVLLKSINDIEITSDLPSLTAAELIAGHLALVQRAHSYDLTVYAGTL